MDEEDVSKKYDAQEKAIDDLYEIFLEIFKFRMLRDLQPQHTSYEAQLVDKRLEEGFIDLVYNQIELLNKFFDGKVPAYCLKAGYFFIKGFDKDNARRKTKLDVQYDKSRSIINESTYGEDFTDFVEWIKTRFERPLADKFKKTYPRCTFLGRLKSCVGLGEKTDLGIAEKQ